MRNATLTRKTKETDIAMTLTDIFDEMNDAVKIAVDVPLGIDATLGKFRVYANYKATATVVLGFMKPGLVSYPAKEYVGKLIFDNLGLQEEDFVGAFDFHDYYIDDKIARSFVPKRHDNSNKGSFGKLLVMAGSSEFSGAAHLAIEGALRSGVGYVTALAEPELYDSLVQKFPEVIYRRPSIGTSCLDIAPFVRDIEKNDVVLLGPGCAKEGYIASLTPEIIMKYAKTVVLDATAINVLAESSTGADAAIRESKARVVLTPHPLEMSRLANVSVEHIQDNRLEFAKKYAKDNACVLVLKGAATIVTDGYDTYVNSSGSSALAKAGSGDVLAGHISGLIASGVDPLRAAALAVYLHGHAADNLADEFTELGVTPSDLPKEMARCLAALINE